MRTTTTPIGSRRTPRVDDHQVDQTLAALGIRQRDSLWRGVTFLFVLAVSYGAVIYIPRARTEADRTVATARSAFAPNAAAPLSSSTLRR